MAGDHRALVSTKHAERIALPQAMRNYRLNFTNVRLACVVQWPVDKRDVKSKREMGIPYIQA